MFPNIFPITWKIRKYLLQKKLLRLVLVLMDAVVGKKNNDKK